MNKFDENLVELIYDYSIGDALLWKSIFQRVLNGITYFNADDIVSDYFSHDYVRYKDVDIDIMNCWFYHEDNKFKQYIINNILHILKCNNHMFYDVLEYHLLV